MPSYTIDPKTGQPALSGEKHRALSRAELRERQTAEREMLQIAVPHRRAGKSQYAAAIAAAQDGNQSAAVRLGLAEAGTETAAPESNPVPAETSPEAGEATKTTKRSRANKE